MNIRLLKASEIECRVQQVKETGCSLLLYKDARCDMKILDETFGCLNWQRSHDLINGNLFCTVSVFNEDTERWVCKQDVGTESNTEKEKGQASDSFKRACFNLGIGRELYTAPFIWIKLESNELQNKNGKYSTNVKFNVAEIGYNDDREIVRLVITDNKGKERYTLGHSKPQSYEIVLTDDQVKELYKVAGDKQVSSLVVDKQVQKKFGCKVQELTLAQYKFMLDGYEKLEAKEGK